MFHIIRSIDGLLRMIEQCDGNVRDFISVLNAIKNILSQTFDYEKKQGNALLKDWTPKSEEHHDHIRDEICVIIGNTRHFGMNEDSITHLFERTYPHLANANECEKIILWYKLTSSSVSHEDIFRSVMDLFSGILTANKPRGTESELVAILISTIEMVKSAGSSVKNFGEFYNYAENIFNTYKIPLEESSFEHFLSIHNDEHKREKFLATSSFCYEYYIPKTYHTLTMEEFQNDVADCGDDEERRDAIAVSLQKLLEWGITINQKSYACVKLYGLEILQEAYNCFLKDQNDAPIVLDSLLEYIIGHHPYLLPSDSD
ncbi:MAG: hypothetical protein ABW189_08245 [Rickettsiales bacterium]